MKGKRTKKLVVFVCTGNTCRSPIAEYLFRKKTQELGLKKLVVRSAGTKARIGDFINEKSAEILLEQGFDTTDFRSQPIDKKMLKDSLAVVCMTDSQRDLLMEMRWQVLRETGEEEIENNVYAFSELVGYEIIDPYGKDMDCYRYVFRLIDGGMSALIDKILPEEIRGKYIEKPRAPRKPKTETQTKKTAEKKTSAKTTRKKKETKA